MVAKHLGASIKTLSLALKSIEMMNKQKTVRLQMKSTKTHLYVVPGENDESDNKNLDCLRR